ncbi:piggyBac transposable element-derived protein 5 [Pteropus vampyrus]|uniref:PiggyBac transposable element-derived protein 5 n=1 Tax=Pteropus vampyrus TaxID=132908 RepID=A0A6P6BXD1_PTEVA|nr:piggyBac transposable element-derived protein 5 [Pteropus vampyrus]
MGRVACGRGRRGGRRGVRVWWQWSGCGGSGRSGCVTRQQPAPGPGFIFVLGPTRKLPPSASALDFLQLFVPDAVLKGMVAQTNMYARKFQERFGGDGAWAEVTLAEMKAFLGYVISTSTSRCESALSVWGRGFYSNDSLARVMSQARFEKILKYFHVVAFRPGPSAPGLYKVQPFLDALQAGFDAAFRPSQTQVLHEPLIDEDPVFIATCTERELRKRKKRKFSLWVRQCSSTGFVVQIYVQLKEGAAQDGLDALRSKPQLHSAVARSLCRGAAGRNYIIFTGPSITSLALFEEFEKQGSRRRSLEVTSSQPLAPRLSATSVRWRRRPGRTVPPSCDGGLPHLCPKERSRDRLSRPATGDLGEVQGPPGQPLPCLCPPRYFISHKPNKTWQQVFWFAVSIAVNNAYILYKMSDAYHVQRYSRAQFGDRLVRELLGLEEASPAH